MAGFLTADHSPDVAAVELHPDQQNPTHTTRTQQDVQYCTHTYATPKCHIINSECRIPNNLPLNQTVTSQFVPEIDSVT